MAAKWIEILRWAEAKALVLTSSAANAEQKWYAQRWPEEMAAYANACRRAAAVLMDAATDWRRREAPPIRKVV
jgi:hypothetical protein